MALKSPLMPSPNAGIASSFSPYTDSPNSPVPFAKHPLAEKRLSNPSEYLAPPPSPYPQHVDPSPVDSNGTENTEIEEEAQEDALLQPPSATDADILSPGDVEIMSPESATSEHMSMPPLNTRLPPKMPSDDEPQSVIHVGPGFRNFEETLANAQSPTSRSENTVVSPRTPEPADSPTDKKITAVSTVNTDVPRFTDRSTPRAQTRQDFDERRSMKTPSLEDIPESHDGTSDEVEAQNVIVLGPDPGETVTRTLVSGLSAAEQELESLRTALSECWTLCNTLANLSSTHRQRTFQFSGKQQVQEQAWRSCWRLCQRLYDSRDQDHASQVFPTLELCRDFCQSLFEARQKIDEESDSVLRVSFELNNHLYNTHDRSLPDAFSERTLDFYITLCHRLMKQRTSLPEETDALLRACWNLAEMLFNLRQNHRESRNSDEELLCSAVQACWELCDLFREGWTQIRPDRGTPRPHQTTFPTQSSIRSTSSRSDVRSNSSLSNRQPSIGSRPMVPETPSTIFDDSSTATSSPVGDTVPGILVLGPSSTGNTGTSNLIQRGASHLDSWTVDSNAFNARSETASTTSSQRTSSTARAAGANSGSHRLRLQYLVLRAAEKAAPWYKRASGRSVQDVVSSLADTALGPQQRDVALFAQYRRLVNGDATLERLHEMPSRRLLAVDVAKAIKWLGNDPAWTFMRDIYRFVFGFPPAEAPGRSEMFFDV